MTVNKQLIVYSTAQHQEKMSILDLVFELLLKFQPLILFSFLQIAQDIIGNLRSLLTEVNHAGAMISRAAKVYTDEVPENGIIGLLSDPDDPKRLLRIS